jgi:hypothetical protein
MELFKKISELIVITKKNTQGFAFIYWYALGGGGVRTGEHLNKIGRKI